MIIQLEPIGYVHDGRKEVIDDHWGDVEACIELDAMRFKKEALLGLTSFSHMIVVYHFHKASADRIEFAARHPRNNVNLPAVGIFSQRGKNRPNHLGVSTCQIIGIDNLRILVRGLDAIDGTPVLDIKPFMQGFEPRGEIREPAWTTEIMAHYW